MFHRLSESLKHPSPLAKGFFEPWRRIASAMPIHHFGLADKIRRHGLNS
jgi:hypothetical protein